jgi:hypothetical protein
VIVVNPVNFPAQYTDPAAQRKRYLGNKMKLNDTTRIYPRTMQQAYPNTVEYGAAIEVPNKSTTLADKVLYVLTAITIILTLVVLK